MLNNGGPRHKRTGLERLMNLEVVWCVVILAVLCIVGATGSGLWVTSFEDVPFYPLSSNDDADTATIYKVFLSFLTYIIILQVRWCRVFSKNGVL
jgi:phospholipid-translocating ATPase